MQLKKRLEQNIKLIYITGALSWGRFFIPVLALFYIANQVSLKQFTIIFSAFMIITLLLEIPSGIIADLLGNKKTLLISRGLFVVEVALLAFAQGFWPFLIAKLISGIGVSLSSGTNQAFTYNTLKRLNRQNEHKKISGKSTMITKISMAFVFIVGATLFKINYKLPAYASLPCILLAFIITFWYKEPYVNKVTITMKSSWEHLKKGLSIFVKNNNITYLLLYSLFLATIIEISMSLSSVFLEKIQIPISLIGVIAFVSSLSIAFGARKADWLENKIGEKKAFTLTHVAGLIGITGMALLIPYVGVLFYVFITLFSGVFSVITNHYMNEQVSHKHRATMLSIKNLFVSLGAAILYPIVGFISNEFSMMWAFAMLSVFMIIGISISEVYRKVKKIKFA